MKLDLRTINNRIIIILIILILIINILFLILAVLWVALGIHFDKPHGEEPEWLSHIHGYFTGTVFFILVVVLAFYGWKASQLMKQGGAQTKLLARVSFPKILVVTILLFVLFTSRCLYDFVSASGQLLVEVKSDRSSQALFLFTCFCLWEIIPTSLVLVLFGTVKATSLGAFSKKAMGWTRDPNYPRALVQEQQGLITKAQIFNNPGRYDSDDEIKSTSQNSLYGSLGTNSPYSTTPVQVHSVNNSDVLPKINK